ncbi:hypothetical protein GCWU000324_03183 [Kingella oralis ATCC 51147]|uniref:Uncharacterized protein n=1 Tax=Kingella oralis ATCC 51147 TaxID=629741 RepID=C4GN95_9NEIS|nr:hypothetical protein GCWU000324_03183 [Kingella oralis ATCC 51147]
MAAFGEGDGEAAGGCGAATTSAGNNKQASKNRRMVLCIGLQKIA